MMDRLSTSDVLLLLEDLCADMEASHEILQEIDAKAGDGDLGVSVKLGFEAVRKGLPQLADTDVGNLLAKSGAAFNAAGASTFGTLMATAFIRAGRVAMGRTSIDVGDICAMMSAAIEGIVERGRASQGERTMLDALVPARDAVMLCYGYDTGISIGDALLAAAQAAREGADATAEMKATHGRAGWLGDRSRGTPDGGAVAISMLLDCAAKHTRSVNDDC